MISRHAFDIMARDLFAAEDERFERRERQRLEYVVMMHRDDAWLALHDAIRADTRDDIKFTWLLEERAARAAAEAARGRP